MALSKDQLKEMLDKHQIPYTEETTVAQMEELLMSVAGRVGEDDEQSDNNQSDGQPEQHVEEPVKEPVEEAQPVEIPIEEPVKEPVKEPEPKTEEDFDPQPPVQERGDKAPLPIGREAGGTPRDGEEAAVQDITKIHRADAIAMKAHLAKQPKVRFFIPLAEGETEGAYETWCGNGFKLTIKKGVMVDLPEQVANDLADHYRINMDAGKESRIDGNLKKEDALR